MSDYPPPPGTVLAHSPASSGIYLASPGIVRLPDGTLLAKGDEHGPGSTETTVARTRIFHSADDGRTWSERESVAGMYWASVFVHDGAVWLLGVTRVNGPIVVRRSDDGGITWTEPTGPQSGLLRDGRFHGAPTPVLAAHGRLWRGFEAVGDGPWGRCFSALLMSAAADADLLRADSWTETNRLPFDPTYLDGRFGGWCEGNAVPLPDGGVGNLLRVHTLDLPEQAALPRASDDGRALSVVPEADFVALPGGCKKFTVRRDPVGGYYWTLSSAAQRLYDHTRVDLTRNTLVLLRSADLRDWEVRSIVLHHPDPRWHGFQYADWIVDGDDLIALVRTAWDDAFGGANRQHDANYLTFHRIANFRNAADPTC